MTKQDINYSPITLDYLVSKVLKYTKSKLRISNPVAMYIAGSHLRRKNRPNSDFDVYLIVKETHQDILLGNQTSLFKQFGVDGKQVDLLVKDFPALYKMLITGDPNAIEIFSEDPIWVFDNVADNENAIKALRTLGDSKGKQALMYANLVGMLNSCGGVIQSAKKILQKKRKPLRVVKRISSADLWLNYVKNIFYQNEFPNPLLATQYRDVRKKFDYNEFSREDMISALQQLENDFLSLRDELWDKKEYLKEQSDKSLEFLSSLFVKALY